MAELVAYTISFNANGGSGSVPSALTGLVESGTAVSLPRSPAPSKSNYTFQGWSTSSSATSGSFSYTIVSTGSAVTRTMYAAWKKKTITIGYDANGGNEAAKYQTVNAGESFTLLSFYPTRTGYTFKGWSTDSSATTPSYQSGGTATRTADTRFYAVWEKITYTVSFNANGGTGAPSSQTKTYGTNLTLSSTVPTRTNYTFKGWSTSNTATTPTYSAGGTYSANASATLYAVWELAIRTITLSYNAGSGSGAPSSESVSTTDATATFQIPNVNPEYEHHVFGGWTDGETIYRYPSSITISESTELSAVWSLETFLITYNANGGSPNPSSDVKSYGNDINLTAVIPVRTGYDFLGWATSSTATEAEYASGAPYTTDASVTLYAVWELQTYTITYNANGGNGAPDSQSKTYGTPVQLSNIKPYLSAKKFVGWAESDTATEATYMPLQTYSGNADLNLYAVWADATYDSADIFANGDSCEIYVQGSDALYGADIMII